MKRFFPWLFEFTLAAALAFGVLGFGQPRPRVSIRDLKTLQRDPRPSVTLAWNAVDSPATAGYRLYWGPAIRFYTNMLFAGLSTNVSLTNLPAGQYFFAVTDYDTNGLESVFSNEVSWTNTPPPPVTNFLLSVSIQQSGDFTNWMVLTNLPAVLVTNSGQPVYWRALMNIQPQ
jgi:hypothetical protein